MRHGIIRLIEHLEEGIYLVVAVLLLVAAVFLLVSTVSDAVHQMQDSADYTPFQLVLTVLDNGLVLFMVAELLHTVRITLRDRGLAAEPFLIVGLIAGIRRVLILTAQSEGKFSWSSQGVELAILIGLILVMAVAIMIWRRSERLLPAQEAET